MAGHTDADSSTPRERSRVEYEDSSFARRLLVGMNLRTAMVKTHNQRFEHRVWPKYLLVVLLLLVAVVFTPSMFPNWIGMEWATARRSSHLQSCA
jgi:hypothetical protein